MKTYATHCKKCYFAAPASSDQPCKFDLIPAIQKANKNIEIKEEFYYINKYICKYGFATNKVDSLNTDFPDINLEEYIKYKAQIHYYLLIDNLNNSLSTEDICNLILKLEIKPDGVSIITRNNSLSQMIKKAEDILADKILWRFHNFLDPDANFNDAIYTVMSTNNHAKKSHYIWMLKDSDLSEQIEHGRLQDINYLCNVIQPAVGIFKSKHTQPDSSHGIFITSKNYYGLVSTVAQSLPQAIQQIVDSDNLEIIEYDH